MCVCGLLALALGGGVEGLEWGIGFGYGYGYGGLDTMMVRHGCGLDGPAIFIYGLVLSTDLVSQTMKLLPSLC